MKQFLSILALTATIFLLSFCSSTTNSNHKHTTPPMTTLDSLQGMWFLVNDMYTKMRIHGRILTEIYVDTSSNQSTYLRYNVYFSDTLVNQDLIMSSADIKIDTSANTGKYLVKVSTLDNTVWCYKINGFYNDGIGTIFSISDTWAHKIPSVYIKN